MQVFASKLFLSFPLTTVVPCSWSELSNWRNLQEVFSLKPFRRARIKVQKVGWSTLNAGNFTCLKQKNSASLIGTFKRFFKNILFFLHRMKSQEFETIRPEQKILTPDEKVRTNSQLLFFSVTLLSSTQPMSLQRTFLVTGWLPWRQSKGLKWWKKENPWHNPEQLQIRPPNCHQWRSRWCGSCGTNIGWVLRVCWKFNKVCVCVFFHLPPSCSSWTWRGATWLRSRRSSPHWEAGNRSDFNIKIGIFNIKTFSQNWDF